MDPESRVWTDVLDVIYSNGGSATHRTLIDDEWIYESSVIINRVDAEQGEIQDAISLLMNSDLLHRKERFDEEGHKEYFQLTKRGFEVAHERELMEQQQETMEQQKETNERLSFFTLILAFAAIAQSIAAALQLDNPTNQVSLLLIALLLALAIAFYQSRPLQSFKI